MNCVKNIFARALLLLAGVCVLLMPCWAEDGDAHEAQIKAAYVFNFLKFIEWSAAAPADSIDVCFRGAAAIRDAFATSVVNKQLGSRRLVVRVLSGKEQAHKCQVVYVDSTAGDAASAPPQALTIGDAAEFTQHGGIIGLYTENNRLRFSVNVGNAKRAGLQVSSNLLKLAAVVEQSPT